MYYHLIGFPFKADVDSGKSKAEMIPIHMHDSRSSIVEIRRQIPLSVQYPRLIIEMVSDESLDSVVAARLAYLRNGGSNA